MGRKSQLKHNVDKQKIRRVKQLLGLSDRILRLTTGYTGMDNLDRHEAMTKLLDQVQALERSHDGAHRKKTRTESLATFTNWLKENGAEFEGVEISEFPDYELGLRAMRDFPAGAPVLSVPRKLILTDDSADKSPLSVFVHNDPLLSTMPNVTLALFLLLEKCNPDSFWKPYLDTMPERYTIVLYFTHKELVELKPSPVYEHALKLCRSIARQYAYIYTKIHENPLVEHPLADIFTYDAYRWAVGTVMTRQNNVMGRVGFIPLWDMCNHEHGTITTDYNTETERSEYCALREFKSGEQIFIFYGVRSNADLFLHNGFVYPDNLKDTLALHLGVSADDPHCWLRKELLRMLGIDEHTQYQLHYASPSRTPDRTPFSPEVITFARIISMKTDELMDWCVRICKCPSEEPTDASIERRAYTFLQTRCSLLARTYKQGSRSPDDDQPLSAHIKNVRLLKETEVCILTHAITHCEMILSKLDQEEKA